MKKMVCAALMMIIMMFSLTTAHAAVKTNGPGIRNNGVYEGIYIDIYSEPYAHYAEGDDNAYTAVGCVWFVSSRVLELTGKSSTIRLDWYNTEGPKHGFNSTETLPTTTKSVVCFSGHVGIIEYVYSDGSIIVSEGGYKDYPKYDYCNIDRYTSVDKYINQNSGWIGYVDLGVPFSAGSLANDKTAPAIQKAEISGVSANGMSVKCLATDDNALKQITIGVWHSAMNVDNAVWQTVSARSNEEVSFYIDFSTFENPMNVTYYVNAYAQDYAGNMSNVFRAGELYRENEPPVITGARITNVTPLGYDVVCTASDNSKVSSIKIGTWHDNMHVDNAVWQVASSDGSSTTIHVNLADFGYAQGTTYHTNVYALDANGNESKAARAGDCFIEKDLSPLVSVANVSASRGYDLVCNVSDYPSAAKICIGTWHDQMSSHDAVWQESTGTQHTFHVDISNFNNAIGVTYHTNLYIIDSAGNWSEAIRAADIMIENVPPVITGAAVENVTADGYDVVCTVSDNSKVKLVRIGTWHDEMHVDNAVWQEVKDPGETIRIRVKVSDFGNKKNVIYHTNIFAYDECGNVSISARAGDPYVTEIQDLILSSTSVTLDLSGGQTAKLTATYSPGDITPTGLVWTTGNPIVATVTDGVVAPVSVGTTTITCTAPNGMSASCTVEVVNTMAVNGIAVNGTRKPGKACVGDTVTWSVEAVSGGTLEYYYDLRCGDKVCTMEGWTSSSVFRHTFTETGEYKLRVYVRSVECDQQIEIETESVIAMLVPERLIISCDQVTMASKGYGSKVKLTVSVEPAGSLYGTITWSSSDRQVAVPSAGSAGMTANISARYTGTTVITVTEKSGLSASCVVTVRDNLSTIVLPAKLVKIDEEAFSGTSIERAVLPENVQEIGAGAFRNAKNLLYVYIPDSVTEIGEGAFEGCDNVCLICRAGSAAETYAIARGIAHTTP